MGTIKETPQDATTAQDAAGTNLPVPQPKHKNIKQAWTDLGNSMNNFFGALRYNSVRAVPAIIVNNSSNILGAAHVWTEIIMFKASLKGGKLVDHASNPFEYAWKAISRVYVESFQGAFAKRGESVDLLKGNPVKNLVHLVTDTEAATAREIHAQGVTPDKVKLSNGWQTRSTLLGLTVWALSALIPDKKESDQDVEKMATLQRTNPIGYIGERLRQAVWVPDWGSHKRQMIGLGYAAIGVCGMLGAWRNRGVDAVSGLLKYKFNGSYFATSLLSLGGSIPMLFASDDQRGFGGFGTIMTGRLAFLPSSIHSKFKAKEPGTAWYAGATAGFQLENWAFALIGGAEKRPDGTIVDHNEARKAAKEKSEQRKIAHKAHGAETDIHVAAAGVPEASALPSTKVGTVASRDVAMPDRVAAHQQQQAELQAAGAAVPA